MYQQSLLEEKDALLSRIHHTVSPEFDARTEPRQIAYTDIARGPLLANTTPPETTNAPAEQDAGIPYHYR